MQREISKIAYIPKYTVSPVIARIFGITPTTPSLSFGRKHQIATSIQVKNSPQVSPYFDFALQGAEGKASEFFSKNGEGVGQSAAIAETLDYYPYGAQRIASGSYSPQRQYIGQVYDPDTSLNYLQARYLQSATGRFISQDPVFWEIGITQDGKDVLSNPQAMNSYSYANDNPIVKSDPNGRNPYIIAGSAAFVTSLAWSAGSDIYQNIQDYRAGNIPWYQLGQARGPDPANRYIKNALATVAVAESAVLAEQSALASGIAKAGAELIGATTAGVTNAGAGVATGSSRDPVTGKTNPIAVAMDFVAGFTGTVVGQRIPNPAGAPPTTIATSVAGTRAMTEQFRSQIGQVIQSAASYVVSLTNNKKSK